MWNRQRAPIWNTFLVLLISLSGHPALGSESVRERIDSLKAEIARHDDLYYRKAEPVISDYAYDALVRELEALQRTAGIQEQSGRVGDDRTGRFPESSHEVPMLSLRKAYEEAELRKHYERMAEELKDSAPVIWIEPKIDGMAFSAIYENGRLVRVLSRGDGKKGEILTENFGPHTGLPERLPDLPSVPERVELRGEAYIPLDTFEEVNARRGSEGRTPFSTPRNLAAGTARLLDAETARSRGLQVAVHGWGAWHPVTSVPIDQEAFLRALEIWKIPAVPHGREVCGVNALLLSIASMQRERSGWNVPADGLVVKLHDTLQRTQLGCGATSPRWAVAWKFPPPRAETTLLGITWQKGQTGRLTPVAELDPVEINGRTVSRASLHNRSYLEREGYQVGDRVYVILAGDVIPALDGIVRAKVQHSDSPIAHE